MDLVYDTIITRGHRISADTTLHLGPPTGILLAAEATRDFQFIGIPPCAIVLTPISTKIECQRERPWQHNDVTHKGLPCAVASACMDYKVQGRTSGRTVPEFRGDQDGEYQRSGSSHSMRPVQLVRAVVAMSIAGWHHVAVQRTREGHYRRHCASEHGDDRAETIIVE